MAADTPADQRKNAVWMSNDELSRTAEALFSFESTNERDESARVVLVRELADRGIDAHNLGYRGGPVVLNPNPKEDPAAKRIRLDQSAADAEAKKAEVAAKKAAEEAARQKLRDAQAAQLLDYAQTGLTRR